MRVAACLIATLTAFAPRAAVAQQQPRPWVERPLSPQYVAVLVEDVDAAVEWYRTAFGLEILDSAESREGAWRIVNLHSDDLFVEIIRDGRSTRAERPLGFFKIGFRVPDVRAVADRLAAVLEERPEVLDDRAHGLRLLQLRDPEGNVIQLSSLAESSASVSD